MSFLISSWLVPSSVKVSTVYIGLSFGFSRRRKNKSITNLRSTFGRYFSCTFQSVPLQKLFPLFPHSSRIAKSCCHWFGYKSIPWMLLGLITDIFLRPNPFVNVIFLRTFSTLYRFIQQLPILFLQSFKHHRGAFLELQIMTIQKYGCSPASAKLYSNVAVGAIMPESNLPSGVPTSPDVAVCGTESLFVHFTAAPVVTITEFGSYASFVRLEEPGTTEIG